MPAFTCFSRTMVAAVALTSTAAAYAAELSSKPMTMKPMHGISFDVGAKHAVSYFLSEGGRCKLTLILAEAFTGEEAPSDVPARYEVAIGGGKSVRLNGDESTRLDVTCHAGARAVTMTPVEEVASRTAR
jgi:hypothetical protein